MKALIFLSGFLILACCTKAQIAVPSAAMPTKEHQVLIDSLLKTTKFETYFVKYCEQRIDKRAEEKKWSYQQIADVKKKIDYKDFKETTLYNFYSFFSTDQLTQLIKITSQYNADAGGSFIFITNLAIQQNLENEINSYYEAAEK